MSGTNGLKWTYYEEDVLPAWVAEIDYPLAPAIARALHQAIDDGLTGYPFPQAEEATFAAATGFWRRHLDWPVDPSWLASAPDVIEGTRRAIEKLTRPDSPVVLHTPVYFPFFGMIERAGRELIEVPSVSDGKGHYQLNLVGIENAFASGAGSIVLCNPWNPVGRVLEQSELHDLIAIARRHDARVIADEIHAPVTYSGYTHIPAATIDPDVVVTVTSASKTFDIPGLKCAQVVLTNGDDRDIWNDYFTPDMVGVGTLGLVASTAAYRDSDDWYFGTVEQLKSNRATVVSMLPEVMPGVEATELQGTYLSWLDFSAYHLTEPSHFMLKEAKVALTGGSQFRGESEHHARLNIATTEQRLIEMLQRMGAALSRLG